MVHKRENDMKVTEMKSSPEKSNPHNVSVRMLYDTEHAQAVHIELKPGEALKKHITPQMSFSTFLKEKALLKLETNSRKLAGIC